MFAFKPDLGKTIDRMEAFWQFSVLDRPVTQFTFEKPPEAQCPLPAVRHISTAERWQDVTFQAELTLAQLSNRVFMGDSLPVAFPNLGPEILAAFYGCALNFGDYGTSWTEPVLHTWEGAASLALDWQHPYLQKLEALTDAMLELGRGKFIVGMPDWHPGGDLLAALRDPQKLAIDLIENPAAVKSLLQRLAPDYFQVYDHWFNKLKTAGQPITSWLDLASYGKYYIPSNDFSAMISTRMYREFFLPGIIEECRFLDRSIYHMDGPGALRHLDALLEIKELHAVQWVPGAGREEFSRWVPVYQKIQAAGKGILVYCKPTDLSLLMQTLKPVGLAISLSGVDNHAQGENILGELTRWTRQF